MTYLIKGFSTRLEDDYPNLLTNEERTSMTATETRQDALRRTEPKESSQYTYMLMTGAATHGVLITITQHYDPVTAIVEAYPSTLTREQAEQWNELASATLTMQPGDSVNSYTQHVHEQAAILGMDTLRELARPLLRDVPTAGEA